MEHEHDEDSVLDRVDDPVVAYANAPRLHAGQFLDPGGARVGRECVDFWRNAVPQLVGELRKRSRCGRLEADVVPCPRRSHFSSRSRLMSVQAIEPLSLRVRATAARSSSSSSSRTRSSTSRSRRETTAPSTFPRRSITTRSPPCDTRSSTSAKWARASEAETRLEDAICKMYNSYLLCTSRPPRGRSDGAFRSCPEAARSPPRPPGPQTT